MESPAHQLQSSASPISTEPHGNELEDCSNTKIISSGDLECEKHHIQSFVTQFQSDDNNNTIHKCGPVQSSEVSLENFNNEQVASDKASKWLDVPSGHTSSNELCKQALLDHEEMTAMTCVDSGIISEHSYSKRTCSSAESGGNACLKIYDAPQQFVEHEEQLAGGFGLTVQDAGIEDLGQGLVSSLVEVIDDVQENRDVVCPNSDSSDDTTSDSDSSDSSSESTSSDSSFERMRTRDIRLAEEIAALKNPVPLKVQGEILSKDLPPVEDLNIKLSEDVVLEPVGKVSQIVSDNTAFGLRFLRALMKTWQRCVWCKHQSLFGRLYFDSPATVSAGLIIIKSLPNKPALDCGTVLFFTKELAIGRVEETFGPVPCPYYSVRFNSKEHVCFKGVELERAVFYAPSVTDFTSFVFVSALKQIRGSDASWINDLEPPPSCLDYSDDEQEREARKQRKNNGNPPRQQGHSGETNGDGRGRGRGRRWSNWHNRSVVRVNTTDALVECQNGWQNAVEKRSTNLNQRQDIVWSDRRESSFVSPFGMPPPPCSQFPGPHGGIPPPPGHGRMPNWLPPPFPAYPVFNVPPPPPPPPPPPL